MTREYKIKEGSTFVLPGGDVMQGGQIIRLDDADAKQHANKLENPPAVEVAADEVPAKPASKKK
jgi:hypothetical protein